MLPVHNDIAVYVGEESTDQFDDCSAVELETVVSARFSHATYALLHFGGYPSGVQAQGCSIDAPWKGFVQLKLEGLFENQTFKIFTEKVDLHTL